MEKGQTTTTQGKDRTCKSKETASTPAHVFFKGTGTGMEKGNSTTRLGKDHACTSKEIATTLARGYRGPRTEMETGH